MPDEDDKVVDLAQMRRDRDSPDKDCTRKDEFGRTLYKYLIEYDHGLEEFMLEIWALNDEDAKAHVYSLNKGTARLKGKIYSEGMV